MKYIKCESKYHSPLGMTVEQGLMFVAETISNVKKKKINEKIFS